LFVSTQDLAGLKFKPPSAKWASANGFSTSKQNLEILEGAAKSKGLTDAVDFLSKVRRLSAVDTYLSSFVEGIRMFTKSDGKLHVRLLQHRTSTGRFSGANPNMQNMPRGGTFPVKKVFVSRFNGGKILEADMAQLEFRTAAFLSQDGVAIEEVSTGFDVHAYTAKVITDAGQPTSRQDAKAHTFAPLYGATGYGRTPAEAAYYTHFNDKYQGVAVWHSRLAKEAINTGKITTPSGREFAFPDIVRKHNGRVSHFTQIKNYPVQSFATADIVPIALLHIERLLKGMQSCIVNTVHDSIVIDVHPDEEQQVIDLINKTNDDLPDLITLQSQQLTLTTSQQWHQQWALTPKVGHLKSKPVHWLVFVSTTHQFLAQIRFWLRVVHTRWIFLMGLLTMARLLRCVLICNASCIRSLSWAVVVILIVT
jgi:DNA polymerase I-like protein with 3'-5' exonuclease and polymerase domains